MTAKLPKTIGGESLATFTGLTKRRIYQLAEEKVIPKPDRGAFPLTETLTALFAWFQKDGDHLVREKLLKVTAERKLAERKERTQAREESVAWVPAALAMQAMSALTQRIEAAPGKVRSEAGLNDQQTEVLRRVLDQARREAAAAIRKQTTEVSNEDTDSVP